MFVRIRQLLNIWHPVCPSLCFQMTSCTWPVVFRKFENPDLPRTWKGKTEWLLLSKFSGRFVLEISNNSGWLGDMYSWSFWQTSGATVNGRNTFSWIHLAKKWNKTLKRIEVILSTRLWPRLFRSLWNDAIGASDVKKKKLAVWSQSDLCPNQTGKCGNTGFIKRQHWKLLCPCIYGCILYWSPVMLLQYVTAYHVRPWCNWQGAKQLHRFYSAVGAKSRSSNVVNNQNQTWRKFFTRDQCSFLRTVLLVFMQIVSPKYGGIHEQTQQDSRAIVPVPLGSRLILAPWFIRMKLSLTTITIFKQPH